VTKNDVQTRPLLRKKMLFLLISVLEFRTTR
jgi:hypothetical protein